MILNRFRLTSHLIRLSFIIIGLTCCLVVLPSSSNGPAPAPPVEPPQSIPPVTDGSLGIGSLKGRPRS